MSYDDFIKDNSHWIKEYRPTINWVLLNGTYHTAINEAVVLSIIKQESNGNMWAVRHEPTFLTWLRTRVGNTKVTPATGYVSKETEMISRSTSFGLCQIMGQTARELGFDKTYLTQLLDPEENIKYAVKYLNNLYNKYKTYPDTFASYNAGSPRFTSTGDYINQPYVNSVSKFKDYFILFSERNPYE